MSQQPLPTMSDIFRDGHHRGLLGNGHFAFRCVWRIDKLEGATFEQLERLGVKVVAKNGDNDFAMELPDNWLFYWPKSSFYGNLVDWPGEGGNILVMDNCRRLIAVFRCPKHMGVVHSLELTVLSRYRTVIDSWLTDGSDAPDDRVVVQDCDTGADLYLVGTLHREDSPNALIEQGKVWLDEHYPRWRDPNFDR